MFTPFSRHRSWNFAHVFNVPLPSLLRMCWGFFRQIFTCSFFEYFLDIWVLWHPTFPAKKNKKNEEPIRKRLGRGTLNTCAKNFRVYHSKTAWIFGLLCGKVQKSRLGIVITWFQWIFDSGVKFDLILVLRSQFFEYLRETLYKHALEHLEAARQEKNRGHFLFFLL